MPRPETNPAKRQVQFREGLPLGRNHRNLLICVERWFPELAEYERTLRKTALRNLRKQLVVSWT